MNDEVRKVFKKQMILNLVLNFMELPHVFYVGFIIWDKQFRNNKPFSEGEALFMSICDTWYAARGIVIPILRILIEPQLLFQVK